MADNRWQQRREEYLFFMPYSLTDRGAGRLHHCPICGAKRWSCWANARKHWQAHSQAERDAYFKSHPDEWRRYQEYLQKLAKINRLRAIPDARVLEQKGK